MDIPVSAQFVASANAAQLHAEARGTETNWPASFVQTDDGWVYRVDNPGSRTKAQIQAAIAAHIPDSDYRPPGPEKDWRSKLQAEIDFLTAQAAGFPANPTAAQMSGAIKRLARNQIRILKFIRDDVLDSGNE